MKKKFLKITIVVLMLIWTCSTIVNALSFTATITPSSTTVAESTEFTVSIKVSNLDVGQNDIDVGSFNATVTIQAGSGGEIKGSIASSIKIENGQPKDEETEEPNQEEDNTNGE